MILVKLGGGLIAPKGARQVADTAVIHALGRELAKATEPLVVIHGAGSFGHTLAKKHGIHQGLVDRSQLGPLSEIHLDMRLLNVQVLESLGASGLHPVAIPPYPVAANRDGKLAFLDVSPFGHALDLGLTPVTHGDLVHDELRGVSVLSGDDIAWWLARETKPSRVVFVTDVDGIFDRPPEEPGARLVPSFAPDELRRQSLAGARGPDVTGGMAGKARAIATIAELGTPVWVVNGRQRGRLSEALQGGRPVGTVVTP
ncbi:MAG TPA: isopentenyl phosphate kinase [Candidatus Thermoplasmatota archaeon]|nr:isopentenyl phosphate kinase [Candidatus Thermoplasmatota archaeon]